MDWHALALFSPFMLQLLGTDIPSSPDFLTGTVTPKSVICSLLLFEFCLDKGQLHSLNSYENLNFEGTCKFQYE